MFAVALAVVAPAAEVLRLDFENGANLAEDTSGNATAGTEEQLNFFGTLTQSIDTRPSSPGSGSANFAPSDFENGKFIRFADADFPDFTPEDSFTLSFWLKPATAFIADGQGFRGIVSGLSENAFTGADWQIDNGVTVEGGSGDGTTTLSRFTGNVTFDLAATDLVADQWQELTLSYHAVSRNLLVYLDGALTGATSTPNGLSMETFLVGTNRGSALLYDGLLDDLLLTDTAAVLDGGGVQRQPGDLDFDGDIDADDWTEFRTGQGADLSALTTTGAYQLGDVDFDGDNDLDDFIDFKSLFNAANGPGALQAAIAGVPEPSALLLTGLMGTLLLGCRRRENAIPISEKANNAMHTKRLSFLTFVSCVVLGFAGQAEAQTTVFSADFEGGAVAADIGTLSVTGPGVQSIVPVDISDGGHSDTSWGTSALFADRSASTGGAVGYNLAWEFTSPVALDGATIDFDYLIRRTNTPNAKSHFVNGFDSLGNTVFSIFLIDREDGGLTNIDPDYTEPTETNERQRQTVGYIDSTNGQSLFASSDIAVGAIPDTNDRSGGGNSFDFFFGGDNDESSVSESSAGVFSVSLSSTGWTLDAKAFETSVLSDFTTTEQSFFDAGAIDLARIEVVGETVQAGGYWDNFSVTGTAVAPPAPLTLQVLSTGEVKLLGGNEGGASPGPGIEIDAIQILSDDVELDGGSLNPAGFTGLAGDASFPAGNGSGNGWEPGLANSATFIAESFLLGSSLIGNSDEISLGNGFVPGGTQDLTFLYREAGSPTATVGLVEYVTVAGLPGDFNDDGAVDGADYAYWRNNLGADESVLNGNGDGLGAVDAGDLTIWRNNFGASSPAAATAGVPEPASFGVLLSAFVFYQARRRRELT